MAEILAPVMRHHGGPMQYGLDLGHELVVDLFAGGGGASLGMEMALGRPVDIAVNHDRLAVAQHQANHPDTRHFCESVFKVDPVRVTGNRPVGLLWASPDCTHHSKAKGGKPVKKQIRGLAWVVVRWARRTRPRAIMLENVEEFRDWGPLDETGRPCKRRKGQQFDAWIHQIERLGYRVQYRLLRACDYGAPTIRRRLFLIARRDGRAIEWPQPTHGPADSPGVRKGRLKPYRTAAECIDWSIPAPSIFDRPRPLANNTLRRIARGVQRFVLDCLEPFIIPLTHRGDARVHAVDEPLRTVTGAHRGEQALIAPYIARIGQTGGNGCYSNDVRDPLTTVTTKGEHLLCAPYCIPRHGERDGQDPRTRSVEQPLPTVTGTGNGASLVAAFIEQANTGMVGHDARKPLSTIVGKGCTQRLVHAHLINLKGADRRARAIDDPAPTVCVGGTHAGLVAALMAPYYGSGSGETGRDLRDPAPTVTSKDRLQLITVRIGSTDYVLTDIGMRMLQPRELYRAQGFPDEYVIDRGPGGEPITKTAQVRMVGNSVCPPVAEALVAANFAHEQKVQVA